MTLRKLFLRSALFLSILFGLNQVAGRLYTGTVLADTTLYLGESQFREHQSEVTLLIIGDSHSARGIDPRMLEGAFNFSSLGENYVQTSAKLRTLIEEGQTPLMLVILPLDLHSFSSFRYNRILQPYYWKRYLDFWELAGVSGEWPHSMQLWLEGAIPYLGGYSQFVDWLRSGGDRQQMDLGYMPRFDDFSKELGREQLAEERVATHLEGYNLLENLQLTYFTRAIDLCHRRGIDVVLVKFPLTTEYREAAARWMDLAAYEAALDELLSTRPGVRVLDYASVFDDHPEYFADSDHLNDAGAQVFTQLLGEELELRMHE